MYETLILQIYNMNIITSYRPSLWIEVNILHKAPYIIPLGMQMVIIVIHFVEERRDR